jgi:hypothetical protein
MNNPITPNNLFATPDDVKALQDWIQLLNGPERVAAMTAAGMAWNLANKLIEKELDKQPA